MWQQLSKMQENLSPLEKKKLALDILLENLIEEKILIDKETLALLVDIDDKDIQSSVIYLNALSDKY